ncbi:MAG: hypothetical protein AAGI66_07890 [Cyanobacteria bacterium P01_H01_bin.74]
MLTGYLYADDGLTVSIQGMQTQMKILETHTDNINGYAIPGYQKKESVVSRFAEYMGPYAVSQVTNTEIGRLRQSGNPLDLALNNQGYFQRLGLSGTVEMTRDGRFKIDSQGYVVSLNNRKVLSKSGQPIKLPYIPGDLTRSIKISEDGLLLMVHPKTGATIEVDRFGVVSAMGTVVNKVDIKQGYVEDSNVMLQEEYMAIMPIRREMEANRQLFIIQNDALSRTIQELKQ